MSDLLERCAVAYVLDLPTGVRPMSSDLADLAARFQPPNAAWRQSLTDELRALPENELAVLDAEFTRRFGLDVIMAEQEPERIGGDDHFLFEHRIRRSILIQALLDNDARALALSSTPFTGTRSAMFRPSLQTATDLQWTMLEPLVRAIAERSRDAYDEAIGLRRRLSSPRRKHAADLGAVFARAKSLVGPKRDPSQVPDAPVDLALVVLSAVLGVVPVIAPASGVLQPGDLVCVAPAAPLQCVAFLVDPNHGGPIPCATVRGDSVLSIWVAAFSNETSVVDLVVTIYRGERVVTVARQRIPARPTAAISLWNPAISPALATAAPDSAAAAAPSLTSGPAARAAALTNDPLVRRALELFFLHSAISDNDLFEIGGASLMRRWSTAIEELARRGEFLVRLDIGPDGKAYRMG